MASGALLLSRRSALQLLGAGALYSALDHRRTVAQLLAFELVLRRDRNLPITLNLNDCILGKLYLGPPTLSDPGQFLCDTLELPYRNEMQEISCIKPGSYGGFVKTQPTADGVDLGWRIQLESTTQLAIQIHTGNTTAQTHGCILVGTRSGSPCTIRGGSSKPARDHIKELYGDGTDRPIRLTVLN